MPRTLTSKEFNALSQRLERMAEGISIHGDEPNFPPHLKQAEFRKKRDQLETLRQKWENLTREAERAYDDYSALFSECESDMSKSDDSLKGFYGKGQAVLGDFGTKVMTKPVGRPKKTDKPAE